MLLTGPFNYYRIGRFLFALALLIAFQTVGLFYTIPSLMYVLIVYTFIGLVRFIVPVFTLSSADFFLDIVFVSAMVHLSFGSYSFLTLLYLFPIIFSSILMESRVAFLLPLTAAILYGAIYLVHGVITEKESIISITLHSVSFFLISLAGYYLRRKMHDQEQHIQRLEEDKIRMQGLERLYRVSADLAHELRNPLASISAAVQFLKEGKHDSEFIDILSDETKRLTNLLNDFLFFSRPAEAPKEEVDLADVLTSLLNSYNTVKKIISPTVNGVIVMANRTFLEIALNNIIKNAVEAARSVVRISIKNPPLPVFTKGGQVGISLSSALGRGGVEGAFTKGRNENVTLEIEDDGPGIDEEIKDKVFEPFFTTKRDGTGLGLALAYRILTNCGGTILTDRSSLGGARFTVILPVENQGRMG